MNAIDGARLLPWTSWDGKPCYLLRGNGIGYVSRLADRVEAEQLASAAELVEDSGRVLAELAWTPGEIHLLAVELNAHLANVLRVSESRGARLLFLEGVSGEGDEDSGGDGGGFEAPPVA
ncbi:hypothetical protein V2E29_36735 [Streptomyces diastatochromogenes]|uniref:hypothetical protein n=1 Tax=Streptomyces diastatochromogenes TaxID=42236 RepID=UPI002F264B04